MSERPGQGKGRGHPEILAVLPRGFDEHRRNQAGIGLAMTPAERLRWLQQTLETLRRWQGRARAGVIKRGC